MQNQQEITPQTEPVQNNYDILKGPFQYLPFTIDHPGQPEDDSNTVKDPTVKTIDRSRLFLSPYNAQKSIDKMSLIQEPSQILAFSNKSQATTLGFQGQKKLKQKYQEVLRHKIRLNEKIKKFLYIYDLEQFEIKNAYILQPSSRILQFWNLFYFLLLTFQFILIPLNIALIGFWALKVIDCIFNMLTAIAINGEMESNFAQIFQTYYKTYLTFDLIFLVSLTTVIEFQGRCWIAIFIVLISSIPRFLDLKQKLQFHYNIFNQCELLLCQIIKVILLIHILTCFWWENFTIEDGYIHSLFIVMNLLSFNSNSINQNDEYEVLVYCSINLVSFFFFGYILSQLMIIFKNDKNFNLLSQFLSQNKLDAILKQKIISHLHNQPQYYHNQFITKLSQKLISEYNLSQRSKLLTQYFKNYNPQTIEELVNTTTEIVCQPNQTIIQEGIVDDCGLYFILEGSVYLQSRTNIKLQTLKQHDSFGEIAFYTEKPRNFTVKSEGVSRILKVQRQQFLQLLTFNDKQIFQEKKDKILFDIELPLRCGCCSSNKHIITRCPVLSFKPDKYLIAKRLTFPHQQVRLDHQRRTFRDMRAFNFYKCASQYEVAFLQLFSDQMSLLSQSQLPYDDNAVRDSYISARSLSKVSKDKSIVKSTSFLKQQSGYDSLANNDNIFNLDQDNEFQVLNSNASEHKYDEFSNLVRTDQQKRTFATAGFGSQSLAANNATQKSLNIIMEHDDSESVSIKSKSNENIEDSPQDKFTRQHNDPKLTFNYNFETQMNELQKQNQSISNPRLSRLGSGSIRQQSSRNSTYRYPDVVSQRNNSSRSLTYSPNSQQKSGLSQQQNVRKSTFSFPQKIIQQTKQIEVSNINDESRSQQQRPSYRKFSTKTGTKVSILPSSFQPFSYLENPIYANNSFGLSNFECMYIFEQYLPHNNYTISIFKANKFKNIRSTLISKYFTEYRFSKMIQQLKLRKLGTLRGTKTLTKIE